MIRNTFLGRWWLVVCIGMLFSACNKEEVPPEPVVRPVQYEQVSTRGGNRTRIFSGVARAGVESQLSFKVPGTISRVSVKVGDAVTEGKLIAELDPVDYELRVKEAEAALKQAEAQARRAQADLERVRALYENNNASKADYDAARAAAESATAQVDSIEKKLRLTELQVKYTTLRAPVTGAIAEVKVEVNENVNAGQPVVLMTSGLEPEVEVAIPEVLITEIKEGKPVITVRFDAIPGREFEAVVTEIGVASTGFATTFPVAVRLKRQQREVLPGMAAEVEFRFESGDATARVWVPPHAVGEDQQGRFVYVVESSEGDVGVVRRRAVKVGEISSLGLEILDGLHDGDRIVTAGIGNLEDGREVKLLASKEG